MNRSLYQTLAHATATNIWGERTNHTQCANPTASPSLQWRHTSLETWRLQESLFGSVLDMLKSQTCSFGSTALNGRMIHVDNPGEVIDAGQQLAVVLELFGLQFLHVFARAAR